MWIVNSRTMTKAVRTYRRPMDSYALQIMMAVVFQREAPMFSFIVITGLAIMGIVPAPLYWWALVVSIIWYSIVS